MKSIILMFTLLYGCLTMQSQNTLKGKIVDSSNNPIDFAEVQLSKSNGDFVTQAYTSESGDFEILHISNGNFNVKVLYLGQKSHEQNIEVTGNLDLHTITIATNQQMAEIVVQAEKKLVERKVDRLVFNTANSIASQGMDAIEALSNTPLVKVVDDKVSIVGKSNVTIMVDDRILYLSGDALTNYLKTLRSDDIERIEVITAPPAKYEASGNSGLINIVMKKNRKMGFYGTASGAYTYNTKNSYSGNASLNFQNKKWNVMLKANANDGRYQSKNNFTYTSPEQGYASNSINNGKYKNIGTDLTVNYQLTDKALIGASYNYTKSNSNHFSNTSTSYSTYPNTVIDSVVISTTDAINKNYYNTFNTFFEQKLDTLGSKLSLGVNYFGNTPDGKTNVKDHNTQNAINNHLYFTNKLNYNVWSANADLAYTLSWADVEFGAKYTNYDNKSEVNYFTIINTAYNFDTTKSNRFNYTENNYATYFSVSRKMSDKIQIKAGLRYEQTEVSGVLLDTNEQFTKSYGKWFPTAYISYNPNDTNSFSFNYSKRINRPYSQVLNPFRYYSSINSYSSGNPKIDPSISNNFELSYVYNSNLSFTLNYAKLLDAFDQLISYQDGVMTSIYYNLYNMESYGLDISYSNKVVSWWETNTGLNTYYSNSVYNTNTTQVAQNGITFSYYSQNTFNLNEAKTVKVLLNWYHQLPNRQDNSRYSAYKTLSTGVKFALLDKKLNINMTLSDVFNTGRSKGTMHYTTNTQTFDNTWNSRRLNLSASYTFGNSKNQKQIKEASFEDKERSK